MIAAPFPIDSLEIRIATSIGYILSSEYGSDIGSLVAGVDKALCRIKRTGDDIRRYDAATDVEALTQAVSCAA